MKSPFLSNWIKTFVHLPLPCLKMMLPGSFWFLSQTQSSTWLACNHSGMVNTVWASFSKMDCVLNFKCTIHLLPQRIMQSYWLSFNTSLFSPTHWNSVKHNESHQSCNNRFNFCFVLTYPTTFISTVFVWKRLWGTPKECSNRYFQKVINISVIQK